MSTFDGLVLIYLVWGAVRGQDRGPARELQALINLALLSAFLLGVGLFRRLLDLLGRTADALPFVSGITGALLVLFTALWVMRLIRHRLADWLAARLSPAWTRISGGIFGVLRVLLAVILLVTVVSAVPLDFVRRPVVDESVTGQLVSSARALLLAGLETGHGPTMAPGNSMQRRLVYP